MKRLFTILLMAATAGAQQPAAGAAPLSALDRATAARNAKRDNTRYDAFFRKYSKRYFGIGFDWKYFKAQGMAESELNAAARSYVGARGVMQLMPSTFQEIQSKRPEFESIDDPEWNIAAGIMHDRYLWDLWEPVVPDSGASNNFLFASYNAGEVGHDHACHGHGTRETTRPVTLAQYRNRRARGAALALALQKDAGPCEEDRRELLGISAALSVRRNENADFQVVAGTLFICVWSLLSGVLNNPQVGGVQSGGFNRSLQQHEQNVLPGTDIQAFCAVAC